MKKVVLAVVLIVILALPGCGNSRQDQAEAMSCRSNLRSLGVAQAMYKGMNEKYATSIFQLDEVVMQNASLITCPSCEQKYRVTGDGESYTISCPCGEHGSIVDGVCSWQE